MPRTNFVPKNTNENVYLISKVDGLDRVESTNQTEYSLNSKLSVIANWNIVIG